MMRENNAALEGVTCRNEENIKKIMSDQFGMLTNLNAMLSEIEFNICPRESKISETCSNDEVLGNNTYDVLCCQRERLSESLRIVENIARTIGI